jgi:hypothetical protein
MLMERPLVNPAKFELIAPLAALALLTSACYVSTENRGPLETSAQSVDLKGAKSVDVHVDMGAGELIMQGGATDLMDADFRYRSSVRKPDVEYNVSGAHGTLTVKQPSGHSMGGDKTTWDLRLNQDVPLDVRVNLGAGEGRLKLGNTTLHSLDVEVGAGQMNVDLTGHPHGDIDVRIRGGVGEANVRLPRQARLDVEAHGGIGQITTHGLTKRGDRWVNEPAEQSDATIHVSVNGGIGQINLTCE